MYRAIYEAGEAGVAAAELCERFSLQPGNVSPMCKHFVQAGLVHVRRVGRKGVRYYPIKTRMASLLAFLYAAFPEDRATAAKT